MSRKLRSDRKEDRRVGARLRFNILSEEAWRRQTIIMGGVVDVMGYKAYVERKNTEAKALGIKG